MAKIPYVFAGGSPRSGTTLLQRMLDNHPMLAMANDCHFVAKCLDDPLPPSDPPLSPELVERVRRYPQLDRMRLPDRDASVNRAAQGAKTYGEFVAGLYTELAIARGKQLAGEKFPNSIRHIRLLDRLFPWVKILHLVRDGRDVALSQKDRVRPDKGPGRFLLWDEEPMAVCALMWQRQILEGRGDGQRLGADRYLEVSYETLVHRPRETVQEILSFLELPFAEESLAFHRGKTRQDEGLSSKKAWLPPTPGLRDWRTQMAPRDVEVYEAVAGDLLSELGYERAYPTISPDIEAIAERCRAWWASERVERPSLGKSRSRPKRKTRAEASATPTTTQNPYVIAGGCPRSGTTLLQRILDHHPMLAMGNDTHFIPKCIPAASPGDLPLMPDMVECVRTFPRFQRLGLTDPAIDRAAARASTYAEFVSGLYEEFAAANQKQVAGDKTTSYMQRIPLLNRLFPWVRFVHLIRDGRDVALSFLEWARPDKGPGRFPLWDEEPIGVSALLWEDRVSEGRRDAAALSPTRYLEVRFEAMVGAPKETLAEMCSFLELPYAEEALEFHRGRARPKPGRKAKSAWIPPTPGLRDWRSQMAPKDVELFEAIAGDLLEQLGYERAYSRISPETADIADRCRAWWTSKKVKRPSPKEPPRFVQRSDPGAAGEEARHPD
jgi:Sulfotransferase family